MMIKVKDKDMSGWRKWSHWILRQKQITVTTWRFRGFVFLFAFALLFSTSSVWLTAIGTSLVCDEQQPRPADVLLLNNVDYNYLVFETAAGLLRSGYSSRTLIPGRAGEGTTMVGMVDEGIIKVMSRVARIEEYEILPVRHIEPIGLNIARQVAGFLENKGVESIILVSPRFRSARSCLVYNRVFNPRGIRVQCHAATAERSPDNWWKSWHGIQDIGLEYLKLLYYRFWVLPRTKS